MPGFFGKLEKCSAIIRAHANTSLSRFVLGAVVGLAAIHYYYYYRVYHPVDPRGIALRAATVQPRETWQDRAINASRVRAINALLDDLAASPTAHPLPPVVIWLGNSQLHSINQFKPGDHLAPYWLIEGANCFNCFMPLGISLPNANLQEHYALEVDITRRLPVKLIVLELCYGQLREDGLRDEFELTMNPQLRADLQGTNVGNEMLVAWDGRTKIDPNAQELAGLTGFLQRPLEQFLVTQLNETSRLWAARAALRGRFLTDLYRFHNWALRIRPSTVRRLIGVRYERNMRALSAMFADLARQHIAVVAYIAPIRHDAPSPYESASYNRWKNEVTKLAEKYGVTLLNLENLVPDNQWGSYKGYFDFMHFQGRGHILVADALRPTVLKLLARTE